MEQLNVLQKIAIFLLLLDNKKVSEILNHFDQKEIVILTEEMLKIDFKLLNNFEKILKEFLQISQIYHVYNFKNFNQVSSLLKHSLGDKKSEKILTFYQLKNIFMNKIFYLNTFDSMKIFLAIQHEPISIISIILIYLNKKLSLKIFFLFHEKKRIKIFENIQQFSGIEKFGLSMLNKILDDIFKKFNVISTVDSGKKYALKFIDSFKKKK
ncbi:Flagellar motor switch protein FliG [Buchnera aphidicola (Tuberolachnus salignus)]|uniref:Flagellar motor switch protein FliG n=1 Tax=Buchnera aphidicola subsp. Tuberolachnus salignus TaxID=98804 RepID=A0A170PBH2_BUCTT|nr:hypothetical protein [Buchnera aphidicola]CUR53029.1 Flagellar motor switch protein FliG [Buchnera aphidicola (Tuberolachnus salignus)]